MEALHWFIDVMLHLDRYLVDWSQSVGIWLNLILFLVIFCETGLVVAPFLPGDSLLFAVGALAALDGEDGADAALQGRVDGSGVREHERGQHRGPARGRGG